MDLNEFESRGKEMIDYICEYTRKIPERRVIANVEPGYLRLLLPKEAPKNSESFDDILKDVESKIIPGLTHWQHPRFHAYFPSGNSFPSVLADMLSDAIGCVGFSWASSPACTELETIMMDWYARALGLPKHFLSDQENSSGGGVIHGSASECILTTMLAARHHAIKALKQNNDNIEDAHFLPKLVAYCSKEAHSAIDKAAMISMVKLRKLEVDENCRVRGATLEAAIQEDLSRGLVPFFVLATAGSTGCCAFDNIKEIGQVCHEYPDVWMHVDAAYAGSGFICPELRVLIEGVEYADSFNTNPNKWMLVNFDCSCLWVKDKYKLTTPYVIDPVYLQHTHSSQTIDYRNWGIPLSRRFRSLKLWFVFRCYGITGLQAYIRNHVRLARRFEAAVRLDRRFEVMNDVVVGLVCFRLRNTDDVNRKFLAKINDSGKLHMIPSMVKGKYTLRFCVVAENASEADVDYALSVISQVADEFAEQGQDLKMLENLKIDSPKKKIGKEEKNYKNLCESAAKAICRY